MSSSTRTIFQKQAGLEVGKKEGGGRYNQISFYTVLIEKKGFSSTCHNALAGSEQGLLSV